MFFVVKIMKRLNEKIWNPFELLKFNLSSMLHKTQRKMYQIISDINFNVVRKLESVAKTRIRVTDNKSVIVIYWTPVAKYSRFFSFLFCHP